MIKGQSSIMEYLLLSFFVLLVIVALIFFFSWFQFSQLGMEQRNIENLRIGLLIDRFSNTPLLVRETAVFDNYKLHALDYLADRGFCTDLESMFGTDWYLEVEVLNRPGSWSIVCPAVSGGERNVSLVLPVNVYNVTDDRTDLALLRVGVYS